MAKRRFGPTGRQSRPSEGGQAINVIPPIQVSFDKDAFNSLIRSQGVRLVHWQALPDPRGMTSRGDVHHSLVDRANSDGYLYREVGCFTGFFQANQKDGSLSYEAVVESSAAYITVPEFYEDGVTPVVMAEWDRLYLSSVEAKVVATQFVTTSNTGTDRLSYPALCVEWLMDADGIEYRQGVDFTITEDGDIKWLTQKRPSRDAATGLPKVYSIRYLYRPFFVVSRLLHEIRVYQTTDPMTQERSVQRGPYQIMAVRERIVRDQNRAAPVPPSDAYRLQYDVPSAAGVLGPK